MDQSEHEAKEMLKPYLTQLVQLEEADRLKQAQITALRLAIEQLKQQALDHQRKYEEEQKKDGKKKGPVKK
ncbi:unnamed protein product (macronuclear) [Paramecium tetraurelia]|uniref:Uncharacterized protein n=1 Tax=Paramecium tetraurelia TaxID=5888 RepID=A0E0B7_PARTE|nr:uncharacterized protein GSPATT00021902001 [Paramecium tetraurelia]CAK88734.1 unnamed protein product [Paramecium tetraurelia]|eukprot:XP_001456131.1 hypothetical protein (macronuclear) [Paramecium tetraurelia strain d4-2]